MVFGFSASRQFGGRIVTTKATEIMAIEMAGGSCFVPGSSISILPIGSPVGTPISYFIPSYVRSKTNTIPRAGQLIIGKYSSKTPINCIISYYPLLTTVIYLDTMSLFGTSR